MTQTESQLKSWQKMKFKDFANTSPSIKLERGKEYPFIPMEVLDGQHKFPLEVRRKSFSGGGSKFANGDTIFARITPCLENGKIARVEDLEEGVGFGSTEFFVFRGKDGVSDSDFVYYLSRTDTIRDPAVKSMVGASGRQRANKTVVDSVQVTAPDLSQQKQIADILSTYDNLIENNTKRIKILEETAQAIYKEWFVFFRFPGHEKAKMVDSKTEFGKIPEGWEVKKVGQLIAKIQRKHKVQRGEYIKEGEFPVIDQGRDFIGGYTANNETVYKDNLPLIVFGDHTRVLKFVDFPFACGADGTQLLSSNSERMPITLFFYALQNVDLSNFAYARHFKFLKEKNVLFPDQQTASAFDSYINPIRGFIRGLLQENIKLRQARDLLLPKLVTGEIEVKL